MNRNRTLAWLVGTTLMLSSGAALAGGAGHGAAGHDAASTAAPAQSPSDAGQMSTYGGGLSSDANATGNVSSAADANRDASGTHDARASEASRNAQSDIEALTGNGNATGAGTALSSAEPSATPNARSPSSNESRDSDSTSVPDTLGPNWRGTMPGTSQGRDEGDRPGSVKL
jgi:hypothetical protein